MTVFEAYITNLGKYAEGQLVGETLKFPATTEEVQSLLKNIGVDGVRYEEFFITAFDGDVMGLYDYLTEYENLDELNHLAHLISELDSDEIETLEAALNKGDHTSSVVDIINLVHNLDCYSLHPGVTDDETLGRIYVEDMELLDVPDNVLPYFDFEAYITNLGKYAEGQFVGETLKFPATTEEVQSLLKNIGVDGVRYEEFFITAFDGDVMGLYDYLTEYENLDELNHLAHLISELDSDEIETLEAALNKGDHTSSVADIINLVHNLDCYSLHPGVTDDETLGRIYVEDMELLDVPDNVLPYFDFEAYGRDMRINEGGHFAPTGYLTRSGDFKEVYHGIEDIPAEHRIFAYPKLNIREQMAAYKDGIDRSSLESERLHPRKEHDDR